MGQRTLPHALRLYLVADLAIRPFDLPRVVQSCVRAGVTCVQLRAKVADTDRVLEVATALQRICSESSVPFIVNDRIEIALEVGANGVHLGVGDIDSVRARESGGADFIVGFSPETDEQIRKAEARGVSYLGIGPLFGTATKLDAGAALGVRECARRVSLTELPTVAIGGIDSSNAHHARLTGADGVAIVSSILRASDPGKAARTLRSAVDLADESGRQER